MGAAYMVLIVPWGEWVLLVPPLVVAILAHAFIVRWKRK